MSYKSIDALQQTLADTVFYHTQSAKKAAGRALGTLIEIITFYLIREWGFERSLAIERPLPEYGNSEITHNVEFTLHPSKSLGDYSLDDKYKSTAKKILNNYSIPDWFTVKTRKLLNERDNILCNACTVAESDEALLIALLKQDWAKKGIVELCQLNKKAYAMFECKRVGVEEGCSKGPQTIEKAKQGAYVAKSTSSLQRIRNAEGDSFGIIYYDGQPILAPYQEMIDKIISDSDNTLLRDFTMSIGVISNHGNWFTSEDQNKELKVLAQSFDWLLFLSDDGLSCFIQDLLLTPTKEYQCVRKAFMNSYSKGSKANVFTKVKMELNAHKAISKYFKENIDNIESWFNIISPCNRDLSLLKSQLSLLNNKNWSSIL